MIISVVPKAVVDVVWDDVVKVLEPSVKTSVGKLRIEHIKEGIEKDIYVLWVVMDANDIVAAIATKVIEYPLRKAMAMEWIGGTRMMEWLPIIHPTLVEFAKKNGCEHLEGYGRKAWGRALAKYGWEPEYTAYRLELNHG